jgi:glycosyltransferase involved in cell wall biosynthesis
VNKEIIDEGENGFLVDSKEEWREALRKLLVYPNLRKKMGMSGRVKVEKHYSAQGNLNRFFSSLE